MTIKMAQTAYDMRDIISVAFLDIGCLADDVSYQLFGNIHQKIRQLYSKVETVGKNKKGCFLSISCAEKGS
jgi:hypothetical protein